MPDKNPHRQLAQLTSCIFLQGKWRRNSLLYLLESAAKQALKISMIAPQNDERDRSPDLTSNADLFPVNALDPSASPITAIRKHWLEYLLETAELALLMLGICLSGALIYSAASPMHRLSLPRPVSAAAMGFAVATTTFLIIRSPLGRRSGAHFNPAITIAYFVLRRIHRWDVLFYVTSQLLGGVLGVWIAHRIVGTPLAASPVFYVVTTPGDYGLALALLLEIFLSAFVMSVVLFATNHRRLASFSPLIISSVTVFYYVLCTSIAGYSVNPARTFSSAAFADIWTGIWIYFVGPCVGMSAAALLFIRIYGPSSVYCAKLFHDIYTPCPFPCRFRQLLEGDAAPVPEELSSMSEQSH